MMTVMAGLTLAAATIHGTNDQQPTLVRVTPMDPRAAVAWTLAQVVIFWAAFLWILPHGMVELEMRLDWPRFTRTGQSGSIALFVLASLLGLWSGLRMAPAGGGTPLPTATTPKSVISGPYRFVRYPMAVAGVLQGIAVGWYFGSLTVVSDAIAGAFVWHFGVRPVEEADLRTRFGEAWECYRRKVRVRRPCFGLHDDT